MARVHALRRVGRWRLPLGARSARLIQALLEAAATSQTAELGAAVPSGPRTVGLSAAGMPHQCCRCTLRHAAARAGGRKHPGACSLEVPSRHRVCGQLGCIVRGLEPPGKACADLRTPAGQRTSGGRGGGRGRRRLGWHRRRNSRPKLKNVWVAHRWLLCCKTSFGEVECPKAALGLELPLLLLVSFPRSLRHRCVNQHPPPCDGRDLAARASAAALGVEWAASEQVCGKWQ